MNLTTWTGSCSMYTNFQACIVTGFGYMPLTYGFFIQLVELVASGMTGCASSSIFSAFASSS